MKRILAALGAVSILTLAAAAQDVPRGGVFLGYTYTRMNSGTNVPAFSANGAGGQFALNFNHWFSAVADLGSVHNGNIGGAQLDTTLTNFLFGPRVTLRHSRIAPYFNILLGGVYASTSVPITLPPGTVVLPPTVNPLASPTATNLANAVAVRASAQQTAFAWTVGGGLDIKIARWLSFRPVGLDYYMTRLQNLRSANDNNQNNLRYTTGFNFTFGNAQ
jgi:opacity protein-like surface antigen